MRRSLVLGDETARHPFLQSLPPHVRGGRAPIPCRAGPKEPRDWGRMIRKAVSQAGDGITATDLRQFLLAYCACFLAVSAFIW